MSSPAIQHRIFYTALTLGYSRKSYEDVSKKTLSYLGDYNGRTPQIVSKAVQAGLTRQEKAKSV